MGTIFPVNLILYSEKNTDVGPPSPFAILRSSIGIIKIQRGKKFLIKKIYHESTYSGLFPKFALETQVPSLQGIDVRNALAFYNVDENIFSNAGTGLVAMQDFSNNLQSIINYLPTFLPPQQLNKVFENLDQTNFKDRPLRTIELNNARYLQVTNSLSTYTNILNVNNIQMSDLQIPFESNKEFILILPRASSKYNSAFYPPSIPYTRSEICISHLYFELEQVN